MAIAPVGFVMASPIRPIAPLVRVVRGERSEKKQRARRAGGPTEDLDAPHSAALSPAERSSEQTQLALQAMKLGG